MNSFQRTDLLIAIEDPRAADVVVLLEAHLAFARAITPPGLVQALDLEGLLHPDVTMFSARRDDVLVGITALKRLDASHAELKSMHTLDSARRQGVARALLLHLLSVASGRNYEKVSLETGSDDTFRAGSLALQVVRLRAL